jgi:hypothetical protein
MAGRSYDARQIVAVDFHRRIREFNPTFLLDEGMCLTVVHEPPQFGRVDGECTITSTHYLSVMRLGKK